MDLDEIQRLVRQGDYEFSFHAQQERLEENLDITEIEAALIGTAEIFFSTAKLRSVPNCANSRCPCSLR